MLRVARSVKSLELYNDMQYFVLSAIYEHVRMCLQEPHEHAAGAKSNVVMLGCCREPCGTCCSCLLLCFFPLICNVVYFPRFVGWSCWLLVTIARLSLVISL
jgi:hypothetical protein